MKKVNDGGVGSTDIRKQAEKVLKGKTTDLKKLSSDDVQILVHELEVHQIELEMQNEELRRAQKELDAACNRYSDLYDFAPIGYFTFDTNGLILQVNLTGAKKLGQERAYLIKRPFSLYIAPDHKDIFYSHLLEVFDTETRTNCELRIMDKKGHQFDVLLESIPVHDSEGNLLARTAMSDITHHKRAEEALKESEEMYRTIIEFSNDMIWTADMLGRFQFCNRHAEEMSGYKLEEWRNKEYFSLIMKEELPNLMKIFSKVLKGQPQQYEATVKKRDGTALILSINTAPLYSKREMIGTVSFGRDITELKKAEETRLENLRLETADKAKSEFLANMSHELRTPLNSSIGFSELLKLGMAGELSEKQKHYVDNIHTSNQFLLSLINDILDLSKIEDGKIELVPDKMSLPETIEETLSLIKEKAMEHKVLLETEFDPELEFIEADRQRFKQILFNLLSNAVKFSKEEGGIVTITAKKEGDMAQISVSDTGIGIKEENISRLFHKFDQLEPGISQKYGGTGLGLAITKHLVELHGGKIYVESKYGTGSTFTFLIPLKAKTGRYK